MERVMFFQPDIVVTEPGTSHALMVVEVKTSSPTSQSEAQLKHYMWEMSCPVGLLVVPTHITIYRNLFTSYSDASVELAGTALAPIEWRRFAGGAEVDFQRSVQLWLEVLSYEGLKNADREESDILERLVLPATLQGEVHAGAPRVSR